MSVDFSKRIFVAGHRGMVGSAIVRLLEKRGYQNIITRTRAELDLLDQAAVKRFFADEQLDEVYLAAAKVGGIYANNSFPAEFIYQNLMIESNVIHQAYRAGVNKLLFLGSSCIYPKFADQPISEDALLGGTLEPTNEPYAIAKIAGIKLCESYNRQYGTDYRSVMPTNLYGPGDNYHPENSHVVPALIRKFVEATKQGAEIVTVWGSGTPKRDFLHVDDMAAASVHVMESSQKAYQSISSESQSHINVGSGGDIAIADLAMLIARLCNFQGELVFDTGKPDGTPRKCLDTSKLNEFGWRPQVDLESGLAQVITAFKEGTETAHQ